MSSDSRGTCVWVGELGWAVESPAAEAAAALAVAALVAAGPEVVVAAAAAAAAAVVVVVAAVVVDRRPLLAGSLFVEGSRQSAGSRLASVVARRQAVARRLGRAGSWPRAAPSGCQQQ